MNVVNNNLTIRFLPGEYSFSATDSLGIAFFLAASDTVIPSPGFGLSSAAPPIKIQLDPGFVTYSSEFYSSQGNFLLLRNIFSNQTIPFTAKSGSIAISENVWVALTVDSETPIILYDTAPLISLPSTNKPITILDYQSSACQPPCSGSGICAASGNCTCAVRFAGSSCESCAPGFFGPACQPCPTPCTKCNQTTGLCSTPSSNSTHYSNSTQISKVKRAEKTCNCLNGKCTSDGKCTCLPGWTNSTELNGLKCAQCAPGYYMASTNNCQGKIFVIFFFSPPSDNSQYVNVDALTAMMSREPAILAKRVSYLMQLTLADRSAV